MPSGTNQWLPAEPVTLDKGSRYVDTTCNVQVGPSLEHSGSQVELRID